MNVSREGAPGLFEAFTKSAQYIVRLQSQQDVWDHLANLIVTYFPAEWAAFARRDPVGKISLHHATPADKIDSQQTLPEEVRTLVSEVLESGFLASQVIAMPGPAMTAFLPIVEEYQVKEVMLIGHPGEAPLPKELLEVYLAVAGLAGTTFERLHSEQELRRHRDHLEELVKERTTELAKAKRQNDLILNSAQEGICGLDLKGRITFVNPFAAETLGWAPGELIGRHAHTTFHHTRPDGGVYPADQCVVHSALLNGEARDVANDEFVRKDGSRFPVAFRTAPILEEGGIVGAVMVFQDITARRRAELEQQKFVSLADHSTEFIGMCDMNFMPFYVNEAGRRLLGLGDLAQACQTPVKDFFFPEDQTFILEEFFPRVLREGCAEIEIRFRHFQTGEALWMIYNVFFVRDSQGQPIGLATVSRNISDRKRAEAAMLEAKAAAETANVAKSQFLANMSHELRTPMNAILGMTDLALEEDLPATVRDYLQTAKQSADSLLELLNEILDLSRIEAGGFQLESTAFDFCTTIEQVVKTLGVRASEKGLELICALQDVPDRLVGDPLRLRQVVVNLVGNAIKFTAKGTVRVSATVESFNPREVTLQLAVADTGIGIAREDQQRIFSPFTQADASTTRQYGGTGLGLTITHRLVSLMGGRIWVESEAGKGSTFRFTVRLGRQAGLEQEHAEKSISQPVLFNRITETVDIQQQSRETSRSAQGALSEVPSRSLRVLLAEDTPANQKLVTYVLGKRGHAVEVVQNGEQALEAIDRQIFDVVLMDVQMPVMDGFCATQAIRKLADPKKARLPIIAMTAHALKGDQQRCLDAGMDSYISKPVKGEELIELVERMAEQSPCTSCRPADRTD